NMKNILAIFILLLSPTLLARKGDCQDRINILENDMVRVIKLRNYAWSYRKDVEAARDENQLSKAQYSEKIARLKTLLNEEEGEGQPCTTCILEAGELILILDHIAKKGKKNLDYFSKNWQSIFPGQAKMLGYKL